MSWALECLKLSGLQPFLWASPSAHSRRCSLSFCPKLEECSSKPNGKAHLVGDTEAEDEPLAGCSWLMLCPGEEKKTASLCGLY